MIFHGIRRKIERRLSMKCVDLVHHNSTQDYLIFLKKFINALL